MYEFESKSASKTVLKRVVFSEYQANVFNLALLDVLPDGETSDISESKNNDIRIILATVIRIISDFFNQNPNVIITFRGNDHRRQRLYRLVIGRELSVIEAKFRIFGLIDGVIERFEPDKHYEVFIIQKLS
ncbi:MAG: DUF6934 family protein [Spirosomataceae bacterium]